MTHSFHPVCNFLLYNDLRTTAQVKVKSSFIFNLFFFFQKRKCGEQKKKKMGGDTNGEWGRRQGGRLGVEMQRGRRRTHVEDITVRVKAQSFFMVRFVRGSRCS